MSSKALKSFNMGVIAMKTQTDRVTKLAQAVHQAFF